MVSGIKEEAVASLCTFDGRVLKQFKVNNEQRQNVSGLGNGIYLLRVPGMDAFKVIVQGSGSPVNTNPLNQGATKF